jgi:hypothetical protein
MTVAVAGSPPAWNWSKTISSRSTRGFKVDKTETQPLVRWRGIWGFISELEAYYGSRDQVFKVGLALALLADEEGLTGPVTHSKIRDALGWRSRSHIADARRVLEVDGWAVVTAREVNRTGHEVRSYQLKVSQVAALHNFYRGAA